MAERRMFAKTIVLSDDFLDMPLSARCLYFTLGMLADDDGFINSPKSIMRQCGASQDDMQILLAKKFILFFESGVIVIKHWRINNYLRGDRHVSTKYIEEKSQLNINSNGSYSLGIPGEVYPVKNSIDKDSIDKDSIDKDSIDKDSIDKDSIDNIYNVEQSIDLSPSKNEIKEIIEYLNNKLGTKYKASKNTTSHINARIKEGFTVDDFKKVIDSKYDEWHDNEKMAQYLRPQTLFGTKFESYLNNSELAQVKKKDSFDIWRDA